MHTLLCDEIVHTTTISKITVTIFKLSLDCETCRDNFRYSQLLFPIWSNNQIICGVGSAHNQQTELSASSIQECAQLYKPLQNLHW